MTPGEQQHDEQGRRVWLLPLAYTKPPMSLNDSPPASRGGRIALSKRKARIREHAHDVAKAAGIPLLQRFSAVLHYQPRDDRARDAMNLYGTHKHLVDGLVEAGVCADDDTAHFTDLAPVIHPARRGEPGRLWLVVTDLSDEPGTQSALPLEGDPA
jgi:crossover junction endodeoxyribonuclease RusA